MTTRVDQALAHGASPEGLCRAIARDLCRRHGPRLARTLIDAMLAEISAAERGR